MGVFNFPNFLLKTNPVLPTSFDDTLSYYEVLGKVVTNLNNMSEGMNNLANSLVSPYDSNKNYKIGDYVWENDKLYKCKSDNVTGAWDSTKWDEVIFVDAIAKDFKDYSTIVDFQLDVFSTLIENVMNSIAEPYDADERYPYGKYVNYNGKLYVCIARSNYEFHPEEWEEINVDTYDTSYNYEIGDYCLYNNELYVCKYHTTGTFEPENWEFCDPENYNSSYRYYYGQYVIYESEYYKCIVEATGEFNEDDWRQITVEEDLHEYVDILWEDFLEHYRETQNIVQTTGNSETDVMSQKAVTDEILPKLTAMGTYTGNNLADIYVGTADIPRGCNMYGLTSSNTYTDYPDTTVKNAFIITLRNTSMWSQTLITYTTSPTTNKMGEIWYRSGSSRNYNTWVRINTKKSELDAAIATVSPLQTTGDDTTKPMSQNATTIELAKRFENCGSLPTGTAISSITKNNSIYTLIQTATYPDFPDSSMTNKNGFVITINNVSMWGQLFISYTNLSAGTTDMGNVWYRTGNNVHGSGGYNNWIKINLKEDTFTTANAENIKHVNFPNDPDNPTSLINIINGNRYYCAYILPTWVTDTLTNIKSALTTLVFGGNNRNYLGIQRDKLAMIIGNPSSSADPVKNATVKLTSYDHALAMFGDSITAGRAGDLPLDDHGHPQYTTHTFAKTIARNLGIVASNFGVGSQGWLEAAGSPSYTAYEKVANTNITNYTDFTLAWGVNDITKARANSWARLGEYNTTDENTLIGQMYKTVNYIYTQVKRANVIIIAPWNGTEHGSFPKYRYVDTDLGHMWDAMKQFCDYYMLPYISMNNSPLNSFTLLNSPNPTEQAPIPMEIRATQVIADGVHPSTNGYKILGQWLAGEIARIIG